MEEVETPKDSGHIVADTFSLDPPPTAPPPVVVSDHDRELARAAIARAQAKRRK